MVLTLTLPEPGQKKRVKDIIIDLLCLEWPLSLSQIHHRVRKKYSKSCSCQAVYKAILELCDGGALSKDDKFYSINLDWVSKLKDFSNHIENNYNNDERIPLMEGVLNAKSENDVTVLTFNSLVDLDKAWMNIKKNYFKKADTQNDITFWKGSHCWWLLVYPELEYLELDSAREKNVKHFFINHGNTSLDKHSQKFYEDYGIPFQIRKDPVEEDLTVFGDVIMQVKLPLSVREDIDKIYQMHKKPSDIDLPSFIKNVLVKKRQINLIITRNKEIAKQLKQNVLNEFNQ